jgi:hypothetical protein
VHRELTNRDANEGADANDDQHDGTNLPVHGEAREGEVGAGYGEIDRRMVGTAPGLAP